MQLEPMDLSRGQKIWFRYSSVRELSGPWIVAAIFSDHRGVNAKLNDPDGQGMLLLLADDDQYGYLQIYDNEHGT